MPSPAGPLLSVPSLIREEIESLRQMTTGQLMEKYRQVFGEGWTALPGYPERRYPARRSFSRAWCKSIFIYVW